MMSFLPLHEYRLNQSFHLQCKGKPMRYLTFLLCLLSFSSVYCHADKLYIHPKSIDKRDDTFHIHTGHNVWIKTSSVDCDKKGFYTLKSDIKIGSWENRMQYEKEWKCPYCHHYWPWGTSCKNEECPSRFTECFL